MEILQQDSLCIPVEAAAGEDALHCILPAQGVKGRQEAANCAAGGQGPLVQQAGRLAVGPGTNLQFGHLL